MNEEELKATIGEAAFNAMSADQRTALMGKVTPPKKDPPKEEPKKEDPKPEDDLRAKAQREKEALDARQKDSKQIEGALKFNLSVTDFVKNNADLLPNEIAEILGVSEKEKYDSAYEKAAAVKTAMIQSFFSIQTNLELLTNSQRASLDDYLKLTKTGKEQKAETIYENLFEPALETLRKVKKAEELGKARSGFASGTKAEDAYKARLMSGSRKTHLGEKGA